MQVRLLLLLAFLINMISGGCEEEQQDEEGDVATCLVTTTTTPRRRSRRSFSPYQQGKEVAEKVSAALDRLLIFSGYDKQIRPQVGGPPVTVTINLAVMSLGPVDENKQTFSLDCYFRQYWVDERLKYNATGVNELVLNWAFLTKIWVPDTFFVNGKDSYLHKITVPNKSCPLLLGSYGYDANDVVFQWADPAASINKKLGLAQFLLVRTHSYDRISPELKRRTRVGTRNDSIAGIEFYFERQTGFFMLQIYTPLILIVMCSWVTFWLIKTEKGGEVPARTVLGANAVLSVVNIGFGGKSRPQSVESACTRSVNSRSSHFVFMLKVVFCVISIFPNKASEMPGGQAKKVAYATALDIFIVLCFFSVFMALCEFALINFIDTLIKHRKIKEAEKEKRQQEAERQGKVKELFRSVVPIVDAMATVNVDAIQNVPLEEEVVDEEETETEKESERPKSILERVDHWGKLMLDRIEALVEKHYGPIAELNVYKNTTEVLWTIDERARIIFPLAFFFMQCIYWGTYLYVL